MTKRLQIFWIVIFYSFAFIALGCIMGFLGFILYKGILSLDIKLIFDDTPIRDALLLKARVFDGIFNAIIGSFFVVTLAMVFALPLGFLTGIYLFMYASERMQNIFSFLWDILSSIPSIVIGLFGLSITIFLHKYHFASLYPSLLISGLSLAILVMPYIIKMTHLALSSVSKEVGNIGLRLGLTPLQNLFYGQLPLASKEILSGVILAIGRAIEDTAVIMMTGAVAMAGIPTSVLQKYEALPFFIYHISSEYSNKEQLNQGFGASLILLVLSLMLFLSAIMLQKIISKRRGFATL